MYNIDNDRYYDIADGICVKLVKLLKDEMVLHIEEVNFDVELLFHMICIVLDRVNGGIHNGYVEMRRDILNLPKDIPCDMESEEGVVYRDKIIKIISRLTIRE